MSIAIIRRGEGNLSVFVEIMVFAWDHYSLALNFLPHFGQYVAFALAVVPHRGHAVTGGGFVSCSISFSKAFECCHFRTVKKDVAPVQMKVSV